jgi:glycosyltransferase involved in cell wall biosynthesis
METSKPSSSQLKPHPHLVWINSGSLEKLDAATWLITTQELRALGWRVTLIASGDPEQTKFHGVELTQIPRPEIFFWRHVVFHYRVIKKILQEITAIDIILFHETSAPWLLIFLAFLRLIGKKQPYFVMDTRTLPMEPEDNSTWKDKLRSVFSYKMNTLGNRYFDGRTVITPRMAEVLLIPGKKLWGIWPSGVRLEDFSTIPSRRVWPKEDEPIQLLYIGSMRHERNLLTLAKAVTQANADGNNFILSIVGDGNARTDLENYARGCGGSIKIFPPVPYKEVPNWLAQAHVGMLPFPDEEKFRVSSFIKLFEYMASGLPVLVTRIESHTNVIGNGNFAFWADSADIQGLYKALLKIQTDRVELPKMGFQASQSASAWTWQSSANKLKIALELGLNRKHLHE